MSFLRSTTTVVVIEHDGASEVRGGDAIEEAHALRANANATAS